ncbi:MAG: diaminopimelate epimerase [Clostridia bacterium]|nr:diaminopimelate epimerase [Clostridia bacterium]
MLDFCKMQGLGNDFICIKYNESLKYNWKIFSKFICDRHYGIGGDGLLIVGKSKYADLSMRIFNSDGTEAEMCGNGIRCLAKFAYEKGLVKKNKIRIETLAGIKQVEYIIENNIIMAIKVNMGKPITIPSRIPVYLPRNYRINSDKCKVQIRVGEKEFIANCLSMGNPHAVVIVSNLKDFNVEKYGCIIENYKFFPNKTNVEFVEIVDKNNIKLRVWERGVGETLACGSGASAAVYSCFSEGEVDNKVKAELRGGVLDFEIDRNSREVYMIGPAVNVYEGKIDL